MHRKIAFVLALMLVSTVHGLPLRQTEDSELGQRTHRRHHHQPSKTDDNLEDEIGKLRKLDAIMGRVEEAAASHVSLDLPLTDGIQQELSAVEPQTNTLVENFSAVALPYDFRRYDLDHDGFVRQSELAEYTGTLFEDNAEPFRIADKNGDGLLTETELLNAPWFFANE